MGKRKQSQAEDGEVVQGVQREKAAAAGPTGKKRRLAKRTNRGKKVAAAAVQQTGTSEPLGVLNDDCLLHVLSFIDGPAQLLQQRAVSRRWGSLASSDPLWRPLFLRTFGPHVYDAADEEQARKGDRPVSRSFSYYPEADEDEEEDVARHAQDDEHPHWEYSDEETEEPQNKKKMGKMGKKTKKKSSKGARGGCGPVDDSSLQASIEHVRRALESKGSADGGTWFYRYVAACRLMPRLRLPHVTDALKRKVRAWCDGTEEVMEYSCYYTGRLDFCVIDLPHYPRGDVHYRLHRLAVLLSLMSTNKHAPKPGDEIRIGYAGKCRTITLARFCYAFLHGKERELAGELDLLTPPPIRPPSMDDKKSKAGRKPSPRRVKCWREFKEPALSLNVEGDFTPFAFFLSGPYGQKTQSFDATYPCLDDYDEDDEEELFGSSADVQASYCFRTPKGGWAPGFFNASFSWCSHAAISTFYNPTRRQILVIKALEEEMVW